MNRFKELDKGPWTVEDGLVLFSDDFTHDVTLSISGDFGIGQKEDYMKQLCDFLNTATPPTQKG